MNGAVRRARLRGTLEAERVLSILEARSRLLKTQERVDVFDALAWLDVMVIFRPLDGLLGAFLKGGRPGALISTKRQLSVQRFTAAHELGHVILNHEPSLDSPEVLRRAAYDGSGPRVAGFASYLQEIEADAFASAFLLPMWLITHHARKQGWSRSCLTKEDIVYQLSLRCGASFQATVWALERHRFISAEVRTSLLEFKPKVIKARLGHTSAVTQTRADAWNLTSGDVGADISATVGDTITTHLTQRAGSGYLWRSSGELPVQFSELNQDVSIDRQAVGSPSIWKIVYRADAPGTALLRFEHKRLWESEPVEEISFFVTVNQPEHGLSRANRARIMAQHSQGFNAV